MEIKCIAKYLKIEDKIKVGGRISSKKGNLTGAIVKRIEDNIAFTEKTLSSGWYLDIGLVYSVKLFAVTQNIEIGDKVFGDDKDSLEDPGWGEFEDCTVTEKREETFMLSTNKRDGADGLASFETNQDNCFKVLGEISPHAIWVKNDDEIEVDNTINSSKRYYKVKCSQCETYH